MEQCPKCGCYMTWYPFGFKCDHCGHTPSTTVAAGLNRPVINEDEKQDIYGCYVGRFNIYKRGEHLTFEDRVLEKLESIEDKLSKLLEKGDK